MRYCLKICQNQNLLFTNKITPNKNLERITKKIKDKYKKQQQRKNPIRKASQKAINWMKKSN